LDTGTTAVVAAAVGGGTGIVGGVIGVWLTDRLQRRSNRETATNAAQGRLFYLRERLRKLHDAWTANDLGREENERYLLGGDCDRYLQAVAQPAARRKRQPALMHDAQIESILSGVRHTLAVAPGKPKTQGELASLAKLIDDVNIQLRG
jgi:hypothetical protein